MSGEVGKRIGRAARLERTMLALLFGRSPTARYVGVSRHALDLSIDRAAPELLAILTRLRDPQPPARDNHRPLTRSDWEHRGRLVLDRQAERRRVQRAVRSGDDRELIAAMDELDRIDRDLKLYDDRDPWLKFADHLEAALDKAARKPWHSGLEWEERKERNRSRIEENMRRHREGTN